MGDGLRDARSQTEAMRFEMALLNVDKLSVHFGDESTVPRRRPHQLQRKNRCDGQDCGESGSDKSVSSLAIEGLIDYPGA